MSKLEKAHEITDAKIQFVSLVDKAANKRAFLITKQKEGEATFTTYGKIVKKDDEQHYVTGIVYEPMVEDSQGDYMTAAEIEKACHWFAKNGNQVDLQHSFNPLKSAAVVESWIAKADFEVDGETVRKGTWLMTVEVADDEVWDTIQKGGITGFSMGGTGTFDEEDTDLSTVEKDQMSHEKKGLFKQMASLFGLDVVEKGQVAERFEARDKSEQFWAAFDALRNTLSRWDAMTDKQVFETDEENIKEALSDFNKIITDILTSGEPVAKGLYAARPVEKAGKSLSTKNKDALQGIYDSLGKFLAGFSEQADAGDGGEGTGDVNKSEVEKEGNDMTKQEITEIVDAVVEKLGASTDTKEDPEKEPVEKSAGGEKITMESIQKMVDAAVKKAAEPEEEEITKEDVGEMIEEAVQKAMEPILKARGIPSSLNDTGDGVQKGAEQHYLHGIL